MCHRWVWWAACAQGRPLFAHHCCHWCQEKQLLQPMPLMPLPPREAATNAAALSALMPREALLEAASTVAATPVALLWLIIPHCYNLENWNSIQLYFVKTPSCVYELSTVKPWYNTFIFGVIVDAEIMVKLHGSEIAFSGGNCRWWQLLVVKIVVGDNCWWWQARLALCANSMWVPAFSLLWPLLPTDMWCWSVTSKPSQPWRWHWERCRRQGRSWSRAVTRDVSVVWNALTQVEHCWQEATLAI